MVGAHLIEYTAERNELESDSSSTTAMVVQRRTVVRRCFGLYSTVEVSLRAQEALAAHHDVNALLG